MLLARRGTKVVALGSSRKRFASQEAREFESRPLRQNACSEAKGGIRLELFSSVRVLYHLYIRFI